MPNIASIIRDHVVLSIRCVDRLYINGYLPRLQTSGQLAYFMMEHLGKPIPSPVLLHHLRERFVGSLQRWSEREQIPLVHFARGQRKDEVAHERRGAFEADEGVVFVGVAQEKCRSFGAHRRRTPSGSVSFDFSRQSVYVNYYYFYFQDRDWGPGFLKVGSYAPYPVKLCLNGHEWAKQQLRREGIDFESLDNGFLACEDPERLQEICDQLGEEDVQACFDRWSNFVPRPLLPEHRAAGYEHRLTIWQMETSLTQVFDRPVYGRQFFNEVIREHLDLGRPDRVTALFPQRLNKRTPPPPFGHRTRVFVAGVEPSIHVDYKRSHVKQYFKEQRALRFGDRRVLALFQALCGFAHLPAGFRHRDLRPQVAALLGDPHYGTSQMTYDLRRLRRRGILSRLPRTHLYVLTTYGLKVALFCSKLYLRIFRPAWATVEANVNSIPHRIQQAFQRLTRELDKLVLRAQLKNLTQTSRSHPIGDT